MTQLQWIDLFQQTLWMMALLSAPVLLVSLAVGVSISIVQVITSIQEQTLSFVPKLLITFVVLLLTAPWMVNTMVTHTRNLLNQMIKFG